MRTSNSRLGRLPVSAIRILIVWTIWLVTPAAIEKLLAVEGDLDPSWRTGVSRWNGSGYDLPVDAGIPAAKSSPGNFLPGGTSLPDGSSSAAPYTLPVDPTANARRSPSYTMPNIDERVSWGATDPMDLVAPQSTLAPPAIDSKDVSIQLPKPDRASANASSGLPPTPSKTGEAESIEELPPPKKLADKNKGEETGSAARSIKEGIASTVTEPAPLESEVLRWYQYPMRWMKGWDSHAEIGLDGSNGNADTLAFQTGLELKRKTDLHTLGIDVNYRQVSSRDVTTEDNGRFTTDYDRLFPGSPWGGFGKFGMEWDKFKAFDLRVWVNGGLGYHWIRRDDATLVTRFGAGASQEIGAPDDDWIPEAVFGIEGERQLTARQKLKGKVEYYPAWENFENYRLISDVAWEILLDGSENLSLRLAATDRYDSTPQGAKANDIYYSLVLLYKF